MAQTITFEQLKAMTVAQMRELAVSLGPDAVKGYTQMNKEHLLPALCHVIGIDMHAHHQAAVDKARIKAQIRELKQRRDAAIEAGDHELVHSVRRQIHHLKHEINKNLI